MARKLLLYDCHGNVVATSYCMGVPIRIDRNELLLQSWTAQLVLLKPSLVSDAVT